MTGDLSTLAVQSRTLTRNRLRIGSSRQSSGDQIELWTRPLALGGPLPVLPLALRNVGVLPVDLEGTYGEARKRSRLG